MEDIHSRSLSGVTRIPSVEVDVITEGMVQSVIAGTDTGDNWWLQEPAVGADQVGELGPLGGTPSFPPRKGA